MIGIVQPTVFSLPVLLLNLNAVKWGAIPLSFSRFYIQYYNITINGKRLRCHKNLLKGLGYHRKLLNHSHATELTKMSRMPFVFATIFFFAIPLPATPFASYLARFPPPCLLPALTGI
jgi:hypothetical protein